MKVQFLIVFFLTAVRCQATESVLDLFPEFKREIGRIDGLERENKALKAEIEARGPDKVAFMAKNAPHLKNIPGNHIIVYDTAITNVGNGYDTSTGIFTAPSNGIYIFSWTVLTQQGFNFLTYLAVNGNVIARNYVDAYQIRNNISGSQNAVINLKKYDKVSVRMRNGLWGNDMHGDGWSTFNGYKLYNM
ncbi:complement C1q tumor necrosis factor-related protein 3-like [Mytilus californianus]|uniref:complement C1q tumor necrosis factor-related protein 3-like n=1 Tax=Mytilus californianus TaxID=6549 RepID=UPI002247053F|nr:complement C1q tumor necrosis factor-related protein 3-like [Mytilus californianus]